MKAAPQTYLLSPIDHKSEYQLTDEVTIEIDKSFENNLRERNPQLGAVEAVPEDNWLNLEVGDIVAVNHFTFFGDIGANKSFTYQDHFELDGKKYFKAVERQIFFKYNNKTPEAIGVFLVCSREIQPIEHFGVYFGDEEVITCTSGVWQGSRLKVLKNAMYLITLDKVDYYKVRKDEVVTVDNEMAGEYIRVKPLAEKKAFLFGLKEPNNHLAECLSGDRKGETILIFRNQGIDLEDGTRGIPEDAMIGIWQNSLPDLTLI